jgi:hypothetical protein
MVRIAQISTAEDISAVSDLVREFTSWAAGQDPDTARPMAGSMVLDLG